MRLRKRSLFPSKNYPHDYEVASVLFEDIKGKKILVTGASSGIGACMARMFADCGARVALHYGKDTDGVNEVAEYIKGGSHLPFLVMRYDLSELSTSNARAMIHRCIGLLGGLDVLINNAGCIYDAKDFREVSDAAWDKTMSVNAKAPFLLSREAFNYMRNHGGGKIINISSISVKYGGSENTLHYAMSKAALDTMTVGLARAGAQYNILVNSVRGGFINTPFHKKIGRGDLEDRIKLIPLKRAGQPIDIARMVLFLASSAGDYITGEVFTIAGGD